MFVNIFSLQKLQPKLVMQVLVPKPSKTAHLGIKSRYMKSAYFEKNFLHNPDVRWDIKIADMEEG